ncbi:metal ABC transporter permease [Desulfomonile tiedjei]|uniref:ABC-type Mn2+/Zn2+ transport system, permease component n=1 Tax=Desulfomonile tiedjei (strain ATCC 49306 / DSM 6799 / DCB-1) TaxID=706587 RepID=I4CBK6_DESTA|nr:iron chelate uptake ABC transporter family permease subunit [Desulfomonile tiedjei]AFM26947.1 ABC-type Mn2+/Zn2+ transport system, permease component [Desulfomonile tiedjei DSM 6799]
MEFVYKALVYPLQQSFFQKALIGGSVAAIVCSVVGCLVILRRMAFLGDALSHAMIAGVAGGYLFMKLAFQTEAYAPAMLVGSLIAAVVTVGSIGFVSRVSRVKDDAAIGIMYTGVFAAGVVMVSIFRNYIHIDLVHFIMGDVLGVADHDLWVAAIAASIVLTTVILFFRQFQLSSFDPVMAASIGMPVVLIDYALTTCVSLVVVSAVSMVGVILVVGLLITPAATAYLLCDRLDRMMMLSAVFGVTSVLGGLYLSIWLDSSGGGAIMIFCTLQFLVVLTVAPQYGLLARWMRLRRMVPEQLVEDVLVTLTRQGGTAATGSLLTEVIGADQERISRALKFMIREGLIVQTPEGLSLSQDGEREARRILRAHRLWETYLHRVGIPAGEVHQKAHELEHVHDRDSVEYLDDLLGHPIRDPHGAQIPENYVSCAAGNVCSLSILREGRTVSIESVGAEAQNSGLYPGQKVTIGPRLEDGVMWSVLLEDGKTITLSHSVADAIKGRVLR